MRKIGLTGGIGSGKSTICQVFASLGIAIYNSDQQAKRIINQDPEVISKISELFGTNIYSDAQLDRAMMASIVFNDTEKLALLNQIVHPAVLKDFTLWAEQQNSAYVILESAILVESGFFKYMDANICVTAPLAERIIRTMLRDNCSENDVQQRIKAQASDQLRDKECQYSISNADSDSVLEQILDLDVKLRQQ